MGSEGDYSKARLRGGLTSRCFLYCFGSHPTAAALCWADQPNTPPPCCTVMGRSAQHPPPLSRYTELGRSAQQRPHPLTQWGDTASRPHPWQEGGHPFGQFRHTCWANCSTCSRLTLPKTAVRGRVKQIFFIFATIFFVTKICKN
jgi:hypothetical protein